MDTLQKTTYYYVIVHKITGKMLLQDCKLPIYWSQKVANERLKYFPEFKVKKIDAKVFNPLIN